MGDAMSHIRFSYQEFEDLVRHFADSVPELLLRHRETAELAFQIEKLRLTEALGSRFTIAIVGQMRVGKSTLLNALIGRKLAPTGVTETTATINWFRYGTGDLCNKFRVHWKDGSTEDRPLAQVSDWIGQQENAEKTRALDFFADSEFLKIVNIIDTPGTRSVLEHHEEATQGLLAEKLEKETFEYGGRADAVVYVINPVGRAADQDLLQLFGDRTRLTGASPYNSIAVVQKWEHLEPDPRAEVEKKCDRLRVQLQSQVAEVIPASGLLANLAREVLVETWASIAKLAMQSTPDAVRYLLRADSYFCEKKAGAALDPDTRSELCRRMEWPALCFSVKLAHSHQISDGDALRQAVLEASSLEQLKSLLRSRFFTLAGLIKAGTVLRKAWDPCNRAMLELRELVEHRREALKLGVRSEDILRSQKDPALALVLEYVIRSRSSVQNELKQIETTQHDLDRIKHQAASNFEFLDHDIACLKCLEALPKGEISEEERTELYRLFGGNGPYIWMRLGLAAAADITEAVKDRLWDRHAYWAQRRWRASDDLLKVCEHATESLAKILDHLEEQSHE